MDGQLIEFEQFLRLQKFQKVTRFIYFNFERRNGRLHSNCTKMFIFSFLMVFIYFSLCCYHILDSLSNRESPNVNFVVFITTIYFTVRGSMLYLKHDEILDFINVLDREFPRNRANQERLELASVYNWHQKRFGYVHIFIYYGLFAFCGSPAILYLLTNKGRSEPITLTQHLLGGWLPFELRQSHRAYPFIWLYDCLGAVSAISFFVTFDAMFNMMQAQLIMHLNALCRQLETLDYTDEARVRLSLRRHQQINRMGRQFEDLYKLALLVMNFVGAISLCFNVHSITVAKDFLTIVQYVLPTIALIFFTFELCLCGTQIEAASERVQEALYNQQWYMTSQKYRKLLLIWLHYAQQTMKVSAYGLFELNMLHFTDIMKLAYNLFAFLKSRN